MNPSFGLTWMGKGLGNLPVFFKVPEDACFCCDVLQNGKMGGERGESGGKDTHDPLPSKFWDSCDCFSGNKTFLVCL